MKKLVQAYICKLSNKETKDKKIYLDGHCASCKLLRLKMSYTATKLVVLNKFECHQQIESLPNKVIKVNYSNRFRIRFPCPVEGCGFKTVDLKKHLFSKHKWSEQESKLQVNYFNVMTDFILLHASTL